MSGSEVARNGEGPFRQVGKRWVVRLMGVDRERERFVMGGRLKKEMF